MGGANSCTNGEFREAFLGSKANHSTSLHSVSYLPRENLTVNIDIQELVFESWKLIVLSRKDFGRGSTMGGITVFYLEFFELLSRHSLGKEVEKMFERKDRFKGSVLLDLLKVITHIEDESWTVKKFLRSLGRKYAARGLTLIHFQVFAAVLLQAIQARFDDACIIVSPRTIPAWRLLLDFVVREFAHDKVSFQSSRNGVLTVSLSQPFNTAGNSLAALDDNLEDALMSPSDNGALVEAF